MTYSDHKFRLGKQLSVNPSQAEKLDHFIEKDGVKYAGNHLIIDIYGASGLSSIEHIKSILGKCVIAAGATTLHTHLHYFSPNGGVSGVVVLAESHMSIHTWPEVDYAAIDIFTCGDANPELCIPVLKSGFNTDRVYVQRLMRGIDLDAERD